MSGGKDILLGRLRDGQPLSRGDELRLTLMLAVPAILAQLSSVLMQYIDSAMVGRLGAAPAASIGLVSTSTWIFNGFAMAVITWPTPAAPRISAARGLWCVRACSAWVHSPSCSPSSES